MYRNTTVLSFHKGIVVVQREPYFRILVVVAALDRIMITLAQSCDLRESSLF